MTNANVTTLVELAFQAAARYPNRVVEERWRAVIDALYEEAITPQAR